MSEEKKTWSGWLNNSRFSYMAETEKQEALLWLSNIKDKILDRANLKPDDILIDIGTGTGLLAFGAYERLKNKGQVIASDAFIDCVEECKKNAKSYEIEDKITFLQADATDTKIPDASVDVVVMRSVMVHILDKPKAINEFFRILKLGGRFSSFDPIISKNNKYYEFINPDSFPDYEKIKEIEDRIMSDENNPLMNFNEDSLRKNFEEAGFKNIDIDLVFEYPNITHGTIDFWFNTSLSAGAPSLKEKYLQYISENEINKYIERLKIELDGKNVINWPKVYIYAEKH